MHQESPEAINPIQVLSMLAPPTGGIFRLAFKGHKSEELPYDASTEMVNAAFEQLWWRQYEDEESSPQVVADEVSDEAWLDAVETMIHDVNARVVARADALGCRERIPI